MKILATAFAYNERLYIPYMVDYYRNQGCSLLILDNYSNDGTYEWLVKNNVLTHRVNTNEAFHLAILQEELTKQVHKLKPDWVVYCGIDSYYWFPGTIRQEIEKAEKAGCSVIQTHHFSIYNTGEDYSVPFIDNYFYASKDRNLRMIAKYSPNFTFKADEVVTQNPNVFLSEGCFVNYGMCKTVAERERTYKRRIKAWEEGLVKGWGTHYKPSHNRNWIWNKEDLLDIRKTKFYTFVK